MTTNEEVKQRGNIELPYESHLLDWCVVLTTSSQQKQEYQVSSSKLAKSSKLFLDLFKTRYTEESDTDTITNPCTHIIEKRRTEIQFNDVPSFEYFVKFTHAKESDVISTDIDKESLLLAAVQLKCPSLAEFVVCQSMADITVTNCWQYWDTGNRLITNVPLLKEAVKYYILHNFEEAAKQKAFKEQSFETLNIFLKHNTLNVSPERDLIPVITSWIDYDANNRQKYMEKLLACIRLGRLSDDDLNALMLHKYAKSTTSQQLLAVAKLHGSSETGGDDQTVHLDGTAISIIHLNQPRIPHEAVFVCGGWEGMQNDPGFGPSAAVQIYDYQEDTWNRAASIFPPALGCGHAYSGCVELNDKVYVVGGYTQTQTETATQGPTSTVKAYDLRVRFWKDLARMHENRNYVSVAVSGGLIYALGGHNGRQRLNSAERYDPTKNRWEMIAPLLHVRSDAGAAGLNGTVYVCGGFNGHQFFSSVEYYNPAVNEWVFVAPMASIRSGVSLVQFEGLLYAIGGNNGINRLASVEKYDPEHNTWTAMPPMHTQRSNFCVTSMRKHIYVIGGWSDQTSSTVSTVERWRPENSTTWETVSSLQMPASANCCCTVKNVNLIQHLLSNRQQNVGS